MDGINIYKRATEGSKFLEFKAVGNLCGTMSEYVSVVLDTDNLPDWTPRCLEAKNIEEINEHEFIIYSVYAGVWPTADRDYAARLSTTTDPDGLKTRLDLERIELPITLSVVTDRVHIPYLKSSWIFEQIDRDCTRVELRAHVDPGGWIPAWLVNWGYRTIPYQFLKNLESQVARCSNQTPSFSSVSAISH